MFVKHLPMKISSVVFENMVEVDGIGNSYLENEEVHDVIKIFR